MSIALLKSYNGTECAIAVYIAISALLLAVSARRIIIEDSPSARRALQIVFLLASVAVLLYGRRHVLRYDLIFNPDEALMAANAMLTHHGWLNWNIIDPLTSGPLNSMILAWPYLIGGDITLFSARLTGIFCIYGLLCSLFFALRRVSDDVTAIIAVVPAVVSFAGLTVFDFIQYSSEQLPIMLLSIAIYLFVSSLRTSHPCFWISAAFIVGMIPFAKLQATPIAAVIGCFVVARAVKIGLMGGGPKSTLRNVAAVTVAATLPAIIFLIPLYLMGSFDDFLKSYLIEPQLRITHWINPLPGLISFSPAFAALLKAYASMFAIGVASIGIAAVFIDRRLTVAPAIAWLFALGAIMTPISFVSISVTGRVYPHYLFLVVPALIIFGGAAFAAVVMAIDRKNRSRMALNWLTFCMALAIVVPAVHGDQNQRVERAGGAFLHGQLLTAPHTLAWLRPTKTDKIVCWGWQAECYVNAAIPPATREATNETQIYETGLRAYFRSRFLTDFAVAHPDFVIDAVAPSSFGLTKPDSQGIASFPEFSQIIAHDFVLLSGVNPPDRCPRLYVRNARLAALEKSMIRFANISATESVAGHPAQALDDRSIFETCNDYWLLPKRTLGTVTVNFAAAGPLASLAILNTRNGDSGDQASDRVRLSARLGGKSVTQTELRLEPFPRWTYYQFDKPVMADGLTIEIQSYRGVGAGLNEVKAYRD